MKKLITALSIASVITLSGCQSNPVINPSSDANGVDGYDVSVDNYNKISDKVINLKFAVNQMGEVEDFPWDEVESDVIEILKDKGVKLSSEGRPVTVTLDKFVAHGSNSAFRKVARGNNLGGIVGSLGGSVLQAVAVHELDRKVAKDSADKATEDDGRNFVPEIGFKVESTDFEANVNLHSKQALGSYVTSTVWLVRQAIAEYFTPPK
jgi:hypothetical protein